MKKHLISMILIVALLAGLLSGCVSTGGEDGKGSSSHDFEANAGKRESLSIVAGSENKELEPILSEFAKSKNVTVQMDYLGSLDIMNLLRTGSVDYDALWPASSMWLTLGDEQHILKHSQSISNMPVVFGIRESKVKELGFDRSDVNIVDISQAIKDGKLSFAMTSATQSNSGASAYIAFLSALAATGEVLKTEDLEKPEVQDEIRALLGGVNRSSGSSNWLVDLFLKSDYDAMVNYEALIISTNHKLKEQGQETLVPVYPVDAISIADSPLAFVSGEGREDKEKLFLELQEYLLSDEVQKKIVDTGRRDAFGRIPEAQKNVFTDWSIDTELILSPIPMPRAETISEALSLYQTSFKKPAYTIYVLDYSGSMRGIGKKQMTEGLEQLLIAENAQKHLLQGTSRDVSTFIAFSSDIIFTHIANGNGEELEQVYRMIVDQDAGGGTDMYKALAEALRIFDQDRDKLGTYQPAIVLLSDGRSRDSLKEELSNSYRELGLDIPIFSIVYGDADKSQLEELADLSRARVFDGRNDLTAAFKSVKGYN